MTLHDRISDILSQRKSAEKLSALSVTSLRARGGEQITLLRNEGATEFRMAWVEERTLFRDEAPIPLRLYFPTKGQASAVVVYFHGGGWVTGDLDTHDGICRGIAYMSGAVVVSVAYRRAPENPFPGPLDDCAHAAHWAIGHAGDLRAAGKPVFLAGDSSGGNLAAVLALEMSREIAGQILIYPAVDNPSIPYPSVTEFWPTNNHGQNRDLYLRFVDLYLGQDGHPDHPRFAPMRRPSLAGAPPAYILTAEFDLLRDEAEAYAERLRREGAAVEMERFPHVNHGFLHLVGIVPEADRALNRIAEWMLRTGGSQARSAG